MQQSWRDQEEWLETDGLGGFASGTVGGIRTRRYHGFLLSATTPPTGRFMLVNGIEATVKTPAGVFGISAQRYDGQVVVPDGFRYIESFDTDPWPTWVFKLPDGTRIKQEFFLQHGQPVVAMSWRVVGSRPGTTMSVRPLLSGRDYHALHQENNAFRFDAQQGNGWVRWQPYPEAKAIPAVVAYSNARYVHQPFWYRRFHYQEEWLRGFDAVEDLGSPGVFEFDLAGGEAALILAAQGDRPVNLPNVPALGLLGALRSAETTRRSGFPSPMHRAASQYIVERESGKSVIAGYPWFADWGRDTFVSIRGLCLATRRLAEAEEILLGWAGHVSRGMLPNRFPDQGQKPEYNSVDASLWYVLAVLEFLKFATRDGHHLTRVNRDALLEAVNDILAGYAAGTRYGIGLDEDGLLMAGEGGAQLTWMDARVGDRVITPRWGKPVEVQALWLNCLSLASDVWPKWEAIGERGAASFRERFWNPDTGFLYDVIDCEGVRGTSDASCRPNQIYAVGGLPLVLLEQSHARCVVKVIEDRLWTPLGLRSLAPGERQYCARYVGGPAERDGAYHQGTVWPWQTGAFVEAWIRVRGLTDESKREARRRFVEPLRKHLKEAGLGHVSEIADAQAPHMPRGCPFQAWSLAELIRLEETVLVQETAKRERQAVHPSVVTCFPRSLK